MLLVTVYTSTTLITVYQMPFKWDWICLKVLCQVTPGSKKTPQKKTSETTLQTLSYFCNHNKPFSQHCPLVPLSQSRALIWQQRDFFSFLGAAAKWNMSWPELRAPDKPVTMSVMLPKEHTLTAEGVEGGDMGVRLVRVKGEWCVSDGWVLPMSNQSIQGSADSPSVIQWWNKMIVVRACHTGRQARET